MKPDTSSPGLLIVLSGPCGTGKTSLALRLFEEVDEVGYTRSVTTRQPRDGLVAEEHYDFVSRERFKQMIVAGDFVQWINPTYDEFYGTRRAPLDEAIASGKDLVFDYCPEGYINLKRLYPDNTVGIFVMAPDLETLQSRLRGRGTESDEELKLRYRMALQDFNFVGLHDYHVINDDFEETYKTLLAIRAAEKCRLHRMSKLVPAYLEHARPSLLRYYDAPGDWDAEDPEV